MKTKQPKQPHEVAKLFTAKQQTRPQLSHVKQQLNEANGKHWIATDSHKMILISEKDTQPTNATWNDIGTGEVSQLAPNALNFFPKTETTPTFTTTIDQLNEIASIATAQHAEKGDIKRIEFDQEGNIKLKIGTLTTTNENKTFRSIAFDANQIATVTKALYEIGARQPIDVTQTGTMSQTIITAQSQHYDIKIIIMPLRITR
jgi:hypothetical protein